VVVREIGPTGSPWSEQTACWSRRTSVEANELLSIFGVQPSRRDEKLVVPLTPVTHKMYMGNSIPSDGTCMFGYDYLKLARDGVKKVGQCTENAAYPINVR
jgi:hypothetical protein